MGSNQKSQHIELLGLVRELKNPLISIAAQANLLDDSRTLETDFIKHEAKFLLNIITQLTSLSLARSSKGIVTQSVNLRTLLDVVLKQLKTQINTQNQTVKTNFPRKLPVVVSIDRTVQIALMCLLTNACRQSADGAKIIVTAKVKQNTLQVQISDEASQITKADHERLLNQFGKQSLPLVQRPETSGLLVYIADQAAQLAGGNLSFSNLRNGAGYILNLPTTEQLRLF